MAVLKINGAAVKSPAQLKVRLLEVGAGETRSASGELVSDRVAVKRRLSLSWAFLEPEELSALLSAAGESFQAEYPDPMGGMRTAFFRCGEAATGVMRMVGGAPVWTDVSMEWTER